jgi:hypothetical protein
MNNAYNAYQDLNNWFKQNLLCLNYQKTHFLHFKIRTSNSIDINMGHMDKPISKGTKCQIFRLNVR